MRGWLWASVDTWGVPVTLEQAAPQPAPSHGIYERALSTGEMISRQWEDMCPTHSQER